MQPQRRPPWELQITGPPAPPRDRVRQGGEEERPEEKPQRELEPDEGQGSELGGEGREGQKGGRKEEMGAGEGWA